MIKSFKIYFLAFVLYTLPHVLFCQKIISLDSQNNSIGIFENVNVLEDKNGGLTIKDITKSSDFKPSKKGILNFGVSQSAFWIKFNLRNNTSEPSLFINIKQPLLSNIQFYYRNKNTSNFTSQSIDNSRFSTRFYKYISFIFKAEVPNNETIECYIRVTGNAQLVVPIQVGVEDEIISEMVTTEMFFGFYAGLLIAMIVYNLFIFLTVKDKSYLFYVVYIIFICINQLTLCGFTSKYLWPDSEWMALQSVNLTSCLGSINAILFMQVFLQVKTNLPRQNPILNVLISLFVIVIFVSILGFIHTSFQIMQLITLVGSVYMLFIGYKISQNGYRPARFYMYAWSILLLGVIIFVLKDFEIIPYNDFTAYTVQYASGVEVVLLSFALGDRINILEKEKQESRAQAILVLEENERIIREQNIILESKVKERTSELQSANKELNRTLKNLKEAQAQLVHSEKMASLGQLTAGIAHEINNPINFVTSSINPLKRDLDFINQIITSAEAFLQEDDKQKRIQNMETLLEDMDYTYLVEEINMLLQGIQEGSTRTSEIVKSLKNFSRLDETDIKKANIIEGIESTLLLLNSSISDAKIQIKKQFNPIPNTTCQPGKLNQVYMNILNNAIYAVKANTQRKEIGIITINTKEENNSILIEIKDNGIGMSAKTKEKLFEPFFTTKDVGEGTGLGLSIVYSIIESHEGKIEVDSELEVGTTFTITLPIK